MDDAPELRTDDIGLPVPRLSDVRKAGVSWIAAAAIQATWSTSSSTVLLPSVFGTLGWLGGPLCLCGFAGLALAVQLKVVEIAARDQTLEDMGDLGDVLGGRSGGNLFRGLLLANQILFLPCALVFCAHSLRALLAPVGTSDVKCHLYWSRGGRAENVAATTWI